MMRFLLIDDERKNNAIEFVKSINTYDGYCVEVKPYKRNRSLNQNSTCHMWLDIIVKDTGQGIDDLKDGIKESMGQYDVKTINGKDFIKFRSTSKFNTKTMSEFMEAIQMIAAQLGLQLPMPDDYYYLKGK